MATPYQLPSSFSGGMAWAVESLKKWTLPQSVMSPVVKPAQVKQSVLPKKKETGRKVLTIAQLQENINAIEAQGGSQEDMQNYVNTLGKNPDGTYSPKWETQAPESSIGKTILPQSKEQAIARLKEWPKIYKDIMGGIVSSIPKQLGNIAKFGTDVWNALLPWQPLKWLGQKAQQLGQQWQEAIQGAYGSRPDSTFTKVGEFAGEMAGGTLLGGWLVKWATVLPKVQKVATKLPFITKVAKWATEGLGFDVASQGEVGIGTGIWAAIPFVSPITRWLGAVTREALGASTGTGGGVISKAWEAASKWGKQLDDFKKGLGTSADDIVTEARDALWVVFSDRRNAYEKSLEWLKWATKKYDIKPVRDSFDDLLGKYGVTKNSKWILDFSRSPALGRFKNDILEMQQVLKGWGKKEWDNTLIWVDKLKQTLDQFSRNTAESKTLDSFVTTLRNQAKSLGTDNPQYVKMLNEYSESTNLIKELQRWLSLGNKASTDTAFRKLSGALRTNNEFRKSLVNALDEASWGFLSSKIAGQQMSEILPRGISRQLTSTGTLIGTWALWLAVVKLIPALVLTSPRAVQLLMRIAWVPARNIWPLLKAIEKTAQAGGSQL